MPWQYMNDGEIQGPVADLEFEKLRGGIAPETKVYKEGWKEWRRLGEVPESEFPQPPPPPPLDESSAKAASIKRRAGAWILDFLLIRYLVSQLGLSGEFWHSGYAWNWSMSESGWTDYAGWPVLFTGVYETLMIWLLGWTLGKFVFGIRVTHEGRKLGWQRSLARFAAKKLNLATLMIGYMVAVFDKDKKALHDYICKTRVYLR